MHDESTDRVVRLLVRLVVIGQVEQVTHVVHADAAIQAEDDFVIGGDLLDRRLLGVVLVLDLADDLLDHVLHRHQAGRAAVLVDHDGDVTLGGLHVVQQVVDRLGLGDIDRRPHQLADVDCAVRAAVALQVGQQVLGVQDPDDVVEALVEHGQAGVAGADDHLEHLVERIVDVDGADADARHHDLVHALLGELDDPVDHLLLLLLDAALLGPGLDQQLELLGGQVTALGSLGPPQEADEQRADPGDDPHDRREQRLDQADRTGDEQREALREVQRHGLWHQLADDDRGERDEQGHHHEGDRAGRLLDRSERYLVDQLGEGVGEGARSDRTGQETEEGDRDLDRGQEAARILGQSAGGLRRAAAIVGQLAETVALDGDEGHLAGGEEPADEDEDDDNQEFHHRTRLPVVLLPSGMGGARSASSTGSDPARSGAGSPPRPVCRRPPPVCVAGAARSVEPARRRPSCPVRRRG